MVSLICAWTNGCANNQDAGDLLRHRAHYDVTLMMLAWRNSVNFSLKRVSKTPKKMWYWLPISAPFNDLPLIHPKVLALSKHNFLLKQWAIMAIAKSYIMLECIVRLCLRLIAVLGTSVMENTLIIFAVYVSSIMIALPSLNVCIN